MEEPPYLPLSKPQLAIPSSLGDESLVLLQAAAYGTGSNEEVAVVAIFAGKKKVVS
jgi:hypothetical protein